MNIFDERGYRLFSPDPPFPPRTAERGRLPFNPGRLESMLPEIAFAGRLGLCAAILKPSMRGPSQGVT
jgi:hypothetical protein